MIAEIDYCGRKLQVDMNTGRTIAMALDPHGPQPAFFIKRRAEAEPLRSGDFVGDVRQGGSCNAESIYVTPHCHGTHTECYGHITAEKQTVQASIYQAPCFTRVISLQGTSLGDENYPGEPSKGQFLTLQALIASLGAEPDPLVQALVVRTLPNQASKRSRDYGQQPDYPVFSTEAITWLARSPMKHLLVDTPSLDRADDGGRLSNHRIWWGLEDPEWELNPAARSITEMIYVQDDMKDGLYWLQLGLSPIVSDATPSRPMLYQVIQESAYGQ